MTTVFNTVAKETQYTWNTIGGTWNANSTPWAGAASITTFNTVPK